MTRLAALLLVALAASIGRADDDGFVKARADFDAIVDAVATNARYERRMPKGPSLTRIVSDLVSHDAAVVRRVEATAWDAARSGGGSYVIESVIRFLHGMDARRDPGTREYGERSGLDVVGGAVVLRQNRGSSHSGPLMQAFNAPFDEFVGDAPLRTPPSPNATDLLSVAVVESRNIVEPSWSDSARIDLGMALGEVCAKDDAGFAKLLARAKTEPLTPHLLLALGWSTRREAVEFLSHAVADLASTTWNSGYSLSPLAAALFALDHADSVAYDRVIAGLSEEQSCRALGEPSALELMRRRLAAVDAAKDAGGREAILAFFATSRSMAQMPGGDDAARALRVLLDGLASSEEAVRGSAATAANALLCGELGEPIEESYFPLSGRRTCKGANLGMLGDAETTVRRCLADVEAGRLAFHDDLLPEHQRATRTRAADSLGGSARTDVKYDDPLREDPPQPIRVAATWTATGLHLRLTNEGETFVAVDPVGLQFGRIVRFTIDTTKRGAIRTETRLRLLLGFVRGYPAVRGKEMVSLAPHLTYETDIAVRAEFRGEKNVDLAIDRYGVFIADARASPVVAFDWTPVF